MSKHILTYIDYPGRYDTLSMTWTCKIDRELPKQRTHLQLSEPKLHLKHNFKAKAIGFHFAERY